MADQYKLIHPVKYYRDYLDSKIRPDGREFDKFRPIVLNVGTIATAEGSAATKIGNTSVVCGIRAELAKPKLETPSDGYLVPGIELSPICAKKYRESANKATAESEVLTCAVTDILTNSGCIDLQELCIHKEHLVWAIYCDVLCLNHDGCIIDAAIIAVIAALKNLKLPKITYDVDIDHIEVDDTKTHQIHVKTLPIATTLMFFNDTILITDPTAEEESLSSTLITIAVCNGKVCFILKPGGTPLNDEQMEYCNKQALQREQFIIELINNSKDESI